LVVDDNQVYLDLLKLGLESFEYRVLIAGSAAEAWLKLEGDRVDLVLLDSVMPVEDGPSLARRIRADRRFSGLPIIFLTGFAGATYRAKAFESGADDLIAKPCNATDLLPRIRYHLKRGTWQQRLDAGLARIQDVERSRDALVTLLVHDMRDLLDRIEGELRHALEPGRLAEEGATDVRKALELAREGARIAEGVHQDNRFRPLRPIERAGNAPESRLST